jgi:hypothetical protein
MSEIRIVNDEQSNREPAGSAAAANMLLWAGLLGLIWGLVGWVNFVALAAGVVLCVLAWLQSKKIGKKVCPGCRAAIEWEATTCPICQRDVE